MSTTPRKQPETQKSIWILEKKLQSWPKHLNPGQIKSRQKKGIWKETNWEKNSINPLTIDPPQCHTRGRYIGLSYMDNCAEGEGEGQK